MPEGFFDAHSRLTAKPVAPAATPLSVTELTRQIERAIKSGVPAAVLVKGEISNYRPRRGGSGHLYFTLKDASACIDCVMWADAAARLKFEPSDGVETLAAGRIGVYADKGKYQLYVSTLSPLGKGALELAFQQLRAKLEKEGLFSPERKKPLPRYPSRIALVTSSATAALQDMLKVLRRFPWLELKLHHVPVQGEGAAEKIAAALNSLNKHGSVDVILLARGGGSLEDLWAFNEEVVARAVAASRIPIVTGIGHEVDVSIADLAADHHAHTPTEAAQTVTAHWRNAKDLVSVSSTRLRRALRQIVLDARQRLASIARHEVFRRPMDRVNVLRQMLDDRQRILAFRTSNALRRRGVKLSELERRWAHSDPRHAIALRRAKLDAMEGRLRALGPEGVLSRGYTITMRKKDGQILRQAAVVKAGETLVTRFADGVVESVVEDSRHPRLF
jgi:exodeoxyribonuclease VII large subunit